MWYPPCEDDLPVRIHGSGCAASDGPSLDTRGCVHRYSIQYSTSTSQLNQIRPSSCNKPSNSVTKFSPPCYLVMSIERDEFF